MNVRIRKAEPDELRWVNEQYSKIKFRPSVYEQEFIAIAEVEGARVGVGRLVSIDANTLELGGMYVEDKCRGFGLAKNLVKFLLHHAQQKIVYCLPFAQLERFYTGFGFEPVAETGEVPEKVLQKWEWCQQTYPQPTLLLHIKA
ncbi:GNAT family N-acetyltransferase [Pontibacter cellulosilyticus]|uniref:GNAT family N-acetyltransferase n=1 Tax=Pontibacter cellulosilyticus TaxID=1720253 RepID=A0A923N8Z4_9BACT|nr:GNAT family N-acetyltransferase [Pontibacter cellulosilyticus]MBC5994398.1 GNAT family N-acetyltransferase [Pontibacter cellulosilyticus]